MSYHSIIKRLIVKDVLINAKCVRPDTKVYSRMANIKNPGPLNLKLFDVYHFNFARQSRFF